MQRIILSFIITLLSTQFYAQNRVSQIREQLMSRSTNSVLVVAHRGDWRNFPENSLEGIENAIKMGVDIVELDVQRTQDGVLILMHDETLNRTTTGGKGVRGYNGLHIKLIPSKWLCNSNKTQSSNFGGSITVNQGENYDKSRQG